MAKTYLITGASGIGAETAKQLVHAGHGPDQVQLFIAAREEDQCQILTQKLRALGAAVEYRSGDLTDAQFAPRLVAECVSRFGRLDGLFNVAGISGRRFGDGPVHECTEEAWAITIETNLTTQYRMCREAVRIMLKQPILADGLRGVILNMSSILGVDPEPQHFDTVAYAASKGAIVAMSRSIAASYAKHKIRVNAIAPSLVRTPMSTRASEDPAILDFLETKHPLLHDVIPVEDVAAACVFLLTDASRAITGQTIVVDAGWSIA
jgi:NAD(P)-dependent dehydrogenase (short-subunit alcohol dehydrogenase family)